MHIIILLLLRLLQLCHTEMIIMRYDTADVEFLYRWWQDSGEETQELTVISSLDEFKRQNLCDNLIKAKQFKYISIDGQFFEYATTDYFAQPEENFQRLQYSTYENQDPIALEMINVWVSDQYYSIPAIECVRTEHKRWFITRGKPTTAKSAFLIERTLQENERLEVTALIERPARLILPFDFSTEHQYRIQEYFKDQIMKSKDRNPSQNPTSEMEICNISLEEHFRLCSITFEVVRKTKYRFITADVRNMNFVKIIAPCVKRTLMLRNEIYSDVSLLPCVVNEEYNLHPQFYLLRNLEMRGSAFVLVNKMMVQDQDVVEVTTVIVNVDNIL